MSLSPAQLLTVMEALKTKCAAADSEIAYFIPTPMMFTSRDDLFNRIDADKTAEERRTTLIYALWIDYLRFELFEPLKDCTGMRLYFELTIFHEDSAALIDEDDDFEKQVLLSKQTHVADILMLLNAFKGGATITGLSEEDFPEREITALSQIENTIRESPASFFRNGVTGSESKLQCVVNIQPVRD